jgi:transcriptional regulator with XRE-family HTH domain
MRSRTVSGELRSLREKRGLSCADVGRRLGVSASKISRIETGNSGLQVEDVAALLDFYEVAVGKRQKLLGLLHREDQKGWWERQAGLPQLWRALIDFENKATRIQDYESMVIPGLLQTSEYSAAIIRGTEPALSNAELDNLVATRMARQTLLTRSTAPDFVAVMREVALHIPVGDPGTMKRQLRHLLAISERSNIELRVVPTGAGAHPGLRGPFMILEFAEEPSLAFMENHDTGIFLDDEGELAGYREALRNILKLAHTPDETAELILSVVSGL